jgi:hypothetical protein
MNGIQYEKLKEYGPTTDSGKAGHSIRKLLPLHPQAMK